MFVPRTKPLLLRESYRVLRSGGVFSVQRLDSFEGDPVWPIAHQRSLQFFDHDPPNFYKIPFGFHDSTVIGRCSSMLASKD